MERFPLLENCNPDDPEEALAWAVVSLPFTEKQAMTPGPDQIRLISKRLVELGLVHGPSLAKLANADGMIHVSQLPDQKLEMQLGAGQRHTLNSSFAWVPVGQANNQIPTVPDVRQLPMETQTAIGEQLRETGAVKDPPRDTTHDAYETRAELFDPRQHTLREIREYLADKPEIEISRVMRLEMMRRPKVRRAVLNLYPGY